MHCLLTGATGYLGRSLLPALLEQGCAVTAQAFRRDVAVADPARLSLWRADLAAIAAAAPLEGVDLVFHLAAVAHQRATPAQYRDLNVEASLELARRARAAGVRRFVFVSSVKAEHGGSTVDGGVSARDASTPAALDYAASKRLAEHSLEAFCRDGPMQLVILRPALVYDAEAPGHLAWLRRWVDLRLPAPPAGGARSMVSRSDFVRLCCALLDPAATAPLRLTLTDGQAYTARRLHAALCAAGGRWPRLPSPPPPLWRLAGNTLDRLRGVAAGSTWQRLAGSDLHAQEGLDRLAFTPRLTFEAALGLGP